MKFLVITAVLSAVFKESATASAFLIFLPFIAGFVGLVLMAIFMAIFGPQIFPGYEEAMRVREATAAARTATPSPIPD